MPLEDYEIIWEDKSAQILENFNVKRGDENLLIEVNQSYLFAHPGLKNPDKATCDDFWKGLVCEIRKVSSRDDALVKVRWFWSKKDIQNVIKGKRKGNALKKVLEGMADNELCPGDDCVINSSDSVACDISIELLKANPPDTSQRPVIDYFWRVIWEEKKQTIKGISPVGCAKNGCTSAWNPDKGEQRYCNACNAWFHLSCLTKVRGVQVEIRDDSINKLELPPLPTQLLDVAYQPIARGGPHHFATGNIRFVKKARDLVENTTERDRITEGLIWQGQDWIKYFHDTFDLDTEDDPDSEKLLIEDQDIYRCSNSKCNQLV